MLNIYILIIYKKIKILIYLLYMAFTNSIKAMEIIYII